MPCLTRDASRTVTSAGPLPSLEKATGKTLEELQAKYANQFFKTEFATLNAAQRDTVFLEIARAGG